MGSETLHSKRSGDVIVTTAGRNGLARVACLAQARVDLTFLVYRNPVVGTSTVAPDAQAILHARMTDARYSKSNVRNAGTTNRPRDHRAALSSHRPLWLQRCPHLHARAPRAGDRVVLHGSRSSRCGTAPCLLVAPALLRLVARRFGSVRPEAIF